MDNYLQASSHVRHVRQGRVHVFVRDFRLLGCGGSGLISLRSDCTLGLVRNLSYRAFGVWTRRSTTMGSASSCAQPAAMCGERGRRLVEMTFGPTWTSKCRNMWPNIPKQRVLAYRAHNLCPHLACISCGLRSSVTSTSWTAKAWSPSGSKSFGFMAGSHPLCFYTLFNLFRLWATCGPAIYNAA